MSPTFKTPKISLGYYKLDPKSPTVQNATPKICLLFQHKMTIFNPHPPPH